MFDQDSDCCLSTTAVDNAEPLRAFFGKHREALIAAVKLLAGRRRERLTLKIIEDLSDGRLSRSDVGAC